MLPPLLRVMLEEPALFGSYLRAYGALFRQDASGWRAHQVRRLASLTALVGGTLLAALLGGVALMVYAATDATHWLLWVVPAAPLVMAAVGAWRLRTAQAGSPSFPRVREQIAEDMHLFGLKERSDESNESGI